METKGMIVVGEGVGSGGVEGLVQCSGGGELSRKARIFLPESLSLSGSSSIPILSVSSGILTPSSYRDILRSVQDIPS